MQGRVVEREMGNCASREPPGAARGAVPTHLAFLQRPIELNIQPSAFQQMTGGRIPQELSVRLKRRQREQPYEYNIRAIVDTGCMRTIIAAPPSFFADLHVTRWGSVTILRQEYETKDMKAALSFNGTTFPRIEVAVTNRNIEGNDGFEWQGIIGMDVMLKCSVYLDKGRFLMLGYEEDETFEVAIA